LWFQAAAQLPAVTVCTFTSTELQTAVNAATTKTISFFGISTVESPVCTFKLQTKTQVKIRSAAARIASHKIDVHSAVSRGLLDHVLDHLTVDPLCCETYWIRFP
jgi:hypothetical protein